MFLSAVSEQSARQKCCLQRFAVLIICSSAAKHRTDHGCLTTQNFGGYELKSERWHCRFGWQAIKVQTECDRGDFAELDYWSQGKSRVGPLPDPTTTKRKKPSRTGPTASCLPLFRCKSIAPPCKDNVAAILAHPTSKDNQTVY